MKNKNYIGKKTMYLMLAAILISGNGNAKKVSFAEEITTGGSIVVQEQEENIEFIGINSVSTSAITVVSGEGIEVEVEQKEKKPKKVKSTKEKLKEKSQKIVTYAKKFLGNRYVYGGSSLKHGTDCSGFVMRVYQHFGYRLARSSAEQARNGRKVKRSNIKPADLLFYKNGGRISHVSMYIGDGKVIHASNEKNGIMISNVRYRKACRCVRILKE